MLSNIFFFFLKLISFLFFLKYTRLINMQNGKDLILEINQLMKIKENFQKKFLPKAKVRRYLLQYYTSFEKMLYFVRRTERKWMSIYFFFRNHWTSSRIKQGSNSSWFEYWKYSSYYSWKVNKQKTITKESRHLEIQQ